MRSTRAFREPATTPAFEICTTACLLSAARQPFRHVVQETDRICFHGTGKRIFVAGAGIGGLAFAASLQLLCKEQSLAPLPVVRLFERDESAETRVGRGYSLSVRSDSGGLQVTKGQRYANMHMCACAHRACINFQVYNHPHVSQEMISRANPPA